MQHLRAIYGVAGCRETPLCPQAEMRHPFDLQTWQRDVIPQAMQPDLAGAGPESIRIGPQTKMAAA